MTESPIPRQGVQWHLTLHHGGDSFLEAIEKRDPRLHSALQEHFTWLRERHNSGRVLFSGPSSDAKMGIVLYANLSTAEVEADVQTEPFVKAGFRTVEVIPWDIHEAFGLGRFSVEPPPTA